MRAIKKDLIICVAVNSCHISIDDTKCIMECLSYGGKAICSARTHRNNVMMMHIILVFINAGYDGYIRFVPRGRYDNLLSAGNDVLVCVIPVGEYASAFENNINTKIFPGKLFRGVP
ncbi:MAG: hypothetical protein A4E59_00777 [Syntrophorhabdus sp. PtaB.Bin027]|nr:MAG: hypothetical protein A4E59_00777 [Syntrophorhabdus sp. PtaB.Bin027]